MSEPLFTYFFSNLFPTTYVFLDYDTPANRTPEKLLRSYDEISGIQSENVCGEHGYLSLRWPRARQSSDRLGRAESSHDCLRHSDFIR